MNVLVFNIETIPDIEGGQKIYDLQGLDDKSTAKAMFHIRQQKTACDFLPLHLQRIIAISVVYRGMSDDMGHEVSVRSLGDENSSEADLLTAFFKEIEGRMPILVSWNGTGFDFPVIHYRTLKNAISAPSYWETGNNNSEFLHDNYLSRHHERHTDLKDVLASYNEEATAPLDDIAKLLGFPGKMGVNGSFSANGSIWDEYQVGNFKGIRDYCETGVLNTYLVYLRYQLMRGELTQEQLEQEFTLLRESLELQSQTGKTHLGAFLKAW